LDTYVEKVLIPQNTRGRSRASNPVYRKVVNDSARARARGDRETVRRLRTRMRQLPRGDPHDPGYRRLRYLRYADDHLLGFTGPKAEAEEIKTRLAGFLREDLKLELSQAKTLITHAKTGAARFLGYEITVQQADHKIIKGRRQINGVIALRVPRDVIKAKCASYLERGEPARRNPLVNEDDHTIVATYGVEYRGLVEYYLLAGDVSRLNRLEWVMATSLLKTNRIWLALAALAADLLAWTARLALPALAATYEPKRLRLRILAVAGRIVRTARRRVLHIDPAWPWADVITTAHQRLCALPAP
jgi:hypothetical protein